MTFRETLEEHLAAISARDIGRFAVTVSSDPEARVIAPDGGAIVGAEAIVEAHRDWFAGDAWTFSPRVALTRESDGLAFGLLDVAYVEAAGTGRFLLTREADGWRLLYDQNTPLPPV